MDKRKSERKFKNSSFYNFDRKIKVLLGDAFDSLDKLKAKKFDMVFLDGDKGNYLNILKKIEKNNLKKGSLIIVDNYFFHGDVVNKKQVTGKGEGVKKLLIY